MTENPSAEALEIADLVYTWGIRRGAEEIDALVKQRVSAERSWWQNRERQRLERIYTLQETVQGFQRAQAERLDTRARLQEPGVREAIKAAMRERDFARDGEYLPDDCYEAFADATLTKIAEMLK